MSEEKPKSDFKISYSERPVEIVPEGIKCECGSLMQLFTEHRSEHGGEIISTVSATGQTGVEMEALTGVVATALTVYDMCKSLSHGIQIRDVALISKTGGKADYNEAQK